MIRTLKALYISPDAVDSVTDAFKVMEVKDDLQTFYDLLNCDLIDIPTRKAFGQYVSIVCDDEGLLKTPHYPSIVRSEYILPFKPIEYLVGRVLIFGPDDGHGNLTPINDIFCRQAMHHLLKLDVADGSGKSRYMLALPESLLPAGGS